MRLRRATGAAESAGAAFGSWVCATGAALGAGRYWVTIVGVGAGAAGCLKKSAHAATAANTGSAMIIPMPT